MGIFEKIEKANQQSLEKIKALRDKPIKASKQFLLFVLTVVAGTFITGLFLFEIVKGVLALFLLGFTAIAGFIAVKAIYESGPAIQQKIRNRKIAMMMKEARLYAIEQLSNEVLRKTELLENKRRVRDELGGMIASMRTTIDREPAGSKLRDQMSANIIKFEENYNRFCVYLTKEHELLKQYEVEVANAKKLDAFNTVASKFISLMSETTDAKLEEMLSVESFRAIDESFQQNTIAIDNIMNDLELK